MSKHTIYLCDVTFSKRSSSGLEKELRNKSEDYRNMIIRRRESIKTNFSGIRCNDYIGLVEYIPNNSNNDIKESSNILVYLYKNKSILSVAYDSCLRLITSFINDNNINSIKLSGDDVERLKNNNINIIDDIKKRTSNIEILVSKVERSANGYNLV